eukprot:gene23703-9244_t
MVSTRRRQQITPTKATPTKATPTEATLSKTEPASAVKSKQSTPVTKTSQSTPQPQSTKKSPAPKSAKRTPAPKSAKPSPLAVDPPADSPAKLELADEVLLQVADMEEESRSEDDGSELGVGSDGRGESGEEEEGGEGEEMDEDEDDEELEDLDSFVMQPGLAEAMQKLQEQIAEPSIFLQPSADVSATARETAKPSAEVSATARETAKVLYQYANRHLMMGTSKSEGREIKGSRLGGAMNGLLPELCADAGFDAEQIWLQLEDSATAALKRVRRLITKATTGVQQGKGGQVSFIKPEFEKDIAALGLMQQSAKLAGKQGGKKGAKKKSGGNVRDLMYEDFFGKKSGGGKGAAADDAEEEEEEDEGANTMEDGFSGEEESESGSGEDDQATQKLKKESLKASRPQLDKESLDVMSSHEKRLARLQERITELEESAMGTKAWHLTGETSASKRPLNSALALDMDFESTVKPPPMPTEEVMADLEVLIKKRIADHQYDDVVYVAPQGPDRRKKGLGELYEDDFVRAAVGGVAEDKDEKIRAEAKAIFQALVVKLDALTHFSFSPKPVVEDMTVKSEVAAILMEEAAPIAVSKVSMQLPSEVYKPASKGKPQAETELSREERKRRRATKKRSSKASKAQKETDQRRRSTAEGGTALVSGRKSVAAATAAISGGKKGAPVVGKTHARTEFGKSTAVFAKLQEQQDQAKAGIAPPKRSKPVTTTSIAGFKL